MVFDLITYHLEYALLIAAVFVCVVSVGTCIGDLSDES